MPVQEMKIFRRKVKPYLQTGPVALTSLLTFVLGFGAIWLMARLFRAQILLSGESLSLRRIGGVLTG